MRPSVCLCAGIIGLAAIGYHATVLSGRATRVSAPTPLARPLAQLPMTLGDWHGEDVELSPDTVRVAAADACLRRDYRNPQGLPVSLYIAYYGNVKDRVPHGPTVCYPYQGWHEGHNEMIALPTDVPAFPQLAVRKLVYEKADARVAVLYWYAANGQQQADTTWQRFDSAFRDLLGHGGAYVFQVMVTAPVTGSSESAFASLERFLRANFGAIAKHFPRQEANSKESATGSREQVAP